MTTATRRYEAVADFLCQELDKTRPSESPDAYPVLDPYLTGFEKGLERAQHTIRLEMHKAMMASLKESR